jgi:hypothetical protein
MTGRDVLYLESIFATILEMASSDATTKWKPPTINWILGFIVAAVAPTLTGKRTTETARKRGYRCGCVGRSFFFGEW